MTSKSSTKEKEENQFTGVARSVVCFRNSGYPNFKIVTLTIEKGRVVKTHYSDPYASFEAAAKLDLENDTSLLNLNNKWEDGKALMK